MIPSNKDTGAWEEARRKLDELATSALTCGTPDLAAMLAALSQIAEQAASEGIQAAIGQARKLREQPPSNYEETLRAMEALEMALEPGPGEAEEAPASASGLVPPELPAVPGTSPAEAPAFGSIAADPELLHDFIVESRDHLAAIEANLLTIEHDPANTEAIHAVFRGFHTIKGLAGFLELPSMQQLAHEIETLLDHARNGQLRLDPARIDVALECADYVRADVGRVAAQLDGAPHSEAASNVALIAKVRMAMQDTGAPASPGAPPSLGPSPAPAPAAITAGATAAEARPGVAGLTSGPAELDMEALAAPGQPNPPPADLNMEALAFPVAAAAPAEQRAGAESSHLVKVATAKLDFLVDMIGELVIAQSMIHHDAALSTVKSAVLQRNLAQLGRITADVQKTAMSMRMVPVGQLFQKSVRLVRDLTRRQGKLAELEMTGEDTQLDRTIVEELADPLMHMIRNSADHGLETPAERTAVGKPPHGRISLKAYHRAGHIAIEIGDDGRGLQREKILAKAREKGLVAPGAELSDKEVFNLIFEPGFSTAEQVTNISGRGVGMDVVRKQLQKLRGRVEIESQPGRGSTFILKLPLTLAIIDGLVVGVGPQRYILPIYAVEEMFRPRADAVFTVENRREMVLIRGSLLPVVRLGRRFAVQAKSESLAESVLVVAESQQTRFCLAVDELLGKQEVVIKNLGEMFRQVPGVAGGAILGDGRVGLILDMDSLFHGGTGGGSGGGGANGNAVHV